MELSDQIPVVTGAGRGLGRHLADALLVRGTIAAAAREGHDATLLTNNAIRAVVPAAFARAASSFPDPTAGAMSATWWSDPKAFERAFSGA